MKKKEENQGQASSLESKVFSKVSQGLGSFSVVGGLSYVDEFQSTNGIFYHFQIGDVPVSIFGYGGKYAKESLVDQFCRASGEIRMNFSKDGGKGFVNLSADSITKVYLQ